MSVDCIFLFVMVEVCWIGCKGRDLVWDSKGESLLFYGN